MSDPVKNAEVEDVLSSIRRLVSEDRRPLSSQPSDSVSAPEKASLTDRLVLTPDHRVDDASRTKDAQETPDTVVEAPVSDPAEMDSLLYKDENIAEDAAEHDDMPEDSSTPEADDEDDPYEFVEATHEEGGDHVQSLLKHPAAEEPGEEIPDGTVPLSAKIEELETAIGRISDDWEPDGISSDDNAGTSAPAMAWEDDVTDDAEDIIRPRANGPVEDATFEEALPEVEDSFEEGAPEPTEAELDIYPDDDSVADDTALETEETGASFDVPLDEMIDEEALREMISDVVRTELQGALGERITRNVRKLVRREIHRALTARDMD